MKSIFRFIFRAADYQSAVHFYGKTLQFPLLMDWDRGPAEKGSVFTANHAEIEILAMPPGKEYVKPMGFEICIEVENVDEYCQYLQSQGISLNGNLENKPWGHRTFSILDPDGIKLIFFSFIEKT